MIRDSSSLGTEQYNKGFRKHERQLEKWKFFGKRKVMEKAVWLLDFCAPRAQVIFKASPVCVLMFASMLTLLSSSLVNPEEYRSPFEECLAQFVIWVPMWQYLLSAHGDRQRALVLHTAVINRPACREHGVDLANVLYHIDVGSFLSEGIYLFYLCIFTSGRLWQNINAMGYLSGISRQPSPEIEISSL